MTERRFVIVAGPAEARIEAISATQEGRVARWQLRQAKLSGNQIDRRINRSLCRTQFRGVYAVGHTAPTSHSAEIEALLTRGPSARIGSHSAAALWGFRDKPGGTVHLTLPPRSSGGTRAGITTHRVDGGEPRYVDSVPVVAPAHALLQIAADLSTRDLERALDEAFSLGIVNRDEVRAVVDGHVGAPGVEVLRRLLKQRLVSNPTRSVGQEKLLALIREAGLPDPEMDVKVGGGYSVDCLWRDTGVAAEYDSFQWHKSRSAWARDRRKDAHCRERGVDLIRVTDEDLRPADRVRTVARLTRRIFGGRESRAV